MTIRDSLFFSFAGEKSTKYGIYNVNMDSGMQEEIFAPSAEIIEETVRGRDKPYFQGIKRSPLKFPVSFAFMDTWDTRKISEVAQWLTSPDYYQELYFTNEIGNNPERIFYAVVVDDATLVHNCLKQGYVKLTFRCDSPYSYTPITTSREYIWDKSSESVGLTDFSQGEKKSLIVNGSGHLTLNPIKPKWSDYPKGTKWSDL
ncbi:phage tail domain-containing protein [Paenibacillus donghaensis]|uniref:Phage tail protein n=1 Tax=Paenibacillus donghaensis TaxID=414771 RepID=A0A2Z2K852_9BACL|nr:phage tail domain-containing protein [Paenibacillus donghaensis]ASA22776.1 phage tail protein [Paenibacillus donghaensis]